MFFFGRPSELPCCSIHRILHHPHVRLDVDLFGDLETGMPQNPLDYQRINPVLMQPGPEGPAQIPELEALNLCSSARGLESVLDAAYRSVSTCPGIIVVEHVLCSPAVFLDEVSEHQLQRVGERDAVELASLVDFRTNRDRS